MSSTDLAVEVKDLWFSYEVTQNTSATAKSLEATKKVLRDGGLSVDAPRQQHALKEKSRSLNCLVGSALAVCKMPYALLGSRPR